VNNAVLFRLFAGDAFVFDVHFAGLVLSDEHNRSAPGQNPYFALKSAISSLNSACICSAYGLAADNFRRHFKISPS